MSWPLVALGDVAPAKPIKLIGYNSSDKIWHVTLDQIESNTGLLLEKTIKPLSEAGLSTHGFDDRHVLYSKLRPYLNKVLLPDETGIGTTELVPMLPASGKLDRVYLAHYLKSKAFVNWISNQTAGAKMPRVSMNTFWEHEIPLPPLSEQKHIAAILDKADSLRRKNQQAIQLADQFLRAVFLDMFGDPVTNPKEFPQGIIRDLTESANYGTSAKASETEGEFPILRMGNITYQGGWDFSNLKYIDLSENDKPKYLARKGDLLFNWTNSKELVGKTAVFEEEQPMAIAGYLIRLRSNQKGNNYYISGYLNSTHGKKTLVNMCKSIVGMANINAQEVQDIKVLIPPIELQNKYEQIVLSTKKRLRNLVASEIASEQLFNALSQRAFAGELK